MKASRLSQAAIVAALRGQTLRIPDLRAVFRSWPRAHLNRHHGHIAPIVDNAIGHMAVTYPLVASRKRDGISRLTAFLYPQARKTQLVALALYTAWLVCWDDAVDANEGGLAADFARAERWRRQTLDMIRRALEIDGTNTHVEEPAYEDDPINRVFQVFGSRFCETAPVDQRRRLHYEIRAFVTACAAEQKLRLERRIPDFNSYMDLRLATIGGTMLCSLVPYATDEPLPAALASAPEIGRMWLQACILLSLLNDMLSLKKELRTDCAINAVSALVEPGISLDEIVAQLEQRMKTAVKEFDEAAERLLQMAGPDEDLAGLVRRYIDGCRATVTGTLEFTLTSPRYKIAKLIQQDGSLEIIL
ncbi:Terpene synthase [Fusarium sp. Ph1]|nr:Terpene synthase [Fusarium sp. Ph1]